jgi:hypothetical protein
MTDSMILLYDFILSFILYHLYSINDCRQSVCIYPTTGKRASERERGSNSKCKSAQARARARVGGLKRERVWARASEREERRETKKEKDT